MASELAAQAIDRSPPGPPRPRVPVCPASSNNLPATRVIPMPR